MYLWLSLRNYMYDCDSVFWSAFTLLNHVRFSSCQVPTYNCDTVDKPAFRLLYHVYFKRLSLHVRACISFAESWMIQFRGLYITLTHFVGLNLALIKMWLSSQAYISLLNHEWLIHRPLYNCASVHGPWSSNDQAYMWAYISYPESWITQFTSHYIIVTQFTCLLLALIKMWLSLRVYISYSKSWTTYYICDSVHGSTFPMQTHVRLSSQTVI